MIFFSFAFGLSVNGNDRLFMLSFKNYLGMERVKWFCDSWGYSYQFDIDVGRVKKMCIL